jgi:adenylate cyclase
MRSGAPRPTGATRTVGASVAFCLLIALALMLLDHGGAGLDRLELQTVDWRFAWRRPLEPAEGVVLVTIDEKSLTELAPRFPWPWSRGVHAAMVDVLHEAGAEAILFDVLFSDRRDPRGEPESRTPRDPKGKQASGDQAFAEAIRRAGNVFLAAYPAPEVARGHEESAAQQAVEVTEDRILASDAMRAKTPRAPDPLPSWIGPTTKEFFWNLPLPELIEAARGVGHAELPADVDRAYRRVAPVRAVDTGRLYPQLALLAAAHRLGVEPREIRVGPGHQALLGKRRIPLSEDGTLAIDFAGPPPAPGRRGTFPRYSYSEVLFALSPLFAARGKEAVHGGIRKEAFRGRIVWIGATAPGLYDLRPSPFSAVNPAVETHANLTAAILEERFLTEPGPWLLRALLLGTALAAGAGLAVASMRTGLLVTLLAAAGFVALSHALFDAQRVILPMAAPVLCLGLCYAGATASRFQAEWRERQRYRDYLDRYLTRDVADEVVKAGPLAMSGRRAEVTVLFADMRGFTTMSEAMDPRQVMAMLDEFFARMVPVIQGRRGTVMGYAGDEIMAVWGVPLERPDHALQGVLAGIEMLAALRVLQASWKERALPVMEIGVGVHTGPVIAGNVGTRDRLQYSVVGDTVNTASRIQGLNKELGTHMLISAATYERVGDRVAVRSHPPMHVRGKAEPLVVYEVLDKNEPPAGPFENPRP